MATRLAWKMTLLFTFTLTTAHLLGLIPDPARSELRRRALVNETLAITSSLLAHYGDERLMKNNFAAIVARYPEIRSACIRRTDGTVLHQIGDHDRYWHLQPGDPSNRDNTYVPIAEGKEQWGVVELSFTNDEGWWAYLSHHPVVMIGLFTVLLNGLMVRWYLLRAFNYLDPGQTVPAHVRTTLDTFAEGVVVLDTARRIVLANDKFKRQIGKTDQELLGRGIDELPWQDESEQSAQARWESDSTTSEGMRLALQVPQGRRIYLVNTSAILGQDGKRKGTIASFDDITPLEQKREELNRMLSELNASRDELRLRNEELQFLATRDSLTGCLNRRTFFEIFDKHWNQSHREQLSLSCFMVDVDHFKSVNDNFGHSMGDEVLRQVSATIQKVARDADIVCRYGGEEFCILLPETGTSAACEVAERIRTAIEQIEFDELSVTASLGVSSIELGASDPQELLDQADKCLYVAKRGGRNQVVRWDEVPDEEVAEEAASDSQPGTGDDASSTQQRRASASEVCIPYPAVTSLHSALAYRDADTAAHSTRVAELCVATASGLMSVKDTYVLEVAALLHDIGKIGVPDAILLKPGPLTEDEWKIMELHDRIGVEIVEAYCSNQQLIDIMRYHHAAYGGRPDAPEMPSGKDIPLGARIVTIADAYDAMVSDRVYRKGRSPEEAFEELRRCAGSQFDPELVERFIEGVQRLKRVEVPSGSKQAVLEIGLELERLAQAVDDRDSTAIKALAARLESSAARGGITEIESVAADIQRATEDDSDLVALLQLVDQLMTLCRSAQRAYTEAHLPQHYARG